LTLRCIMIQRVCIAARVLLRNFLKIQSQDLFFLYTDKRCFLYRFIGYVCLCSNSFACSRSNIHYYRYELTFLACVNKNGLKYILIYA